MLRRLFEYLQNDPTLQREPATAAKFGLGVLGAECWVLVALRTGLSAKPIAHVKRTVASWAPLQFAPVQFVPLVVAMYVAGTVSGATGFGVGIVGSISLAVLVGPKLAVVLLSIVSSCAATNQVWKFRHELGEVKRIRWLLLPALIGAIFGSFLLIVLPYSVLAIALGTFTLIYVLTSLVGFRPTISSTAEKVLSPTVGMVAGLINSSLGSSGPVLGPYFLALRIRPEAFIVCLSAAFLEMGLVRIGTLVALQQYTLPIVASSLGLLVPTFLGQFTGFWLQPRIPRHVFERIILGLLSIAAAYLVYQGVLRAI
jgi:uncharacterized protein